MDSNFNDLGHSNPNLFRLLMLFGALSCEFAGEVFANLRYKVPLSCTDPTPCLPGMAV